MRGVSLSSSPPPPPHYSPPPTPLEGNTVAAVLLSAVIVSAAAGNALVCAAIARERALRRPANVLVASLAAADLLVASFVMPAALANDVLGYWALGPRLCDTWVALDVMGCTASILHLSAISLQRYARIEHPLRRQPPCSAALGAVAVLWLVAALVSFLPVGLGLHRSAKESIAADDDDNANADDDGSRPACALDLSPQYAVVSSCISFFFPCAVMVLLYGRLFLSARRHVSHIRAVSVSPLNPQRRRRRPERLAAEHKAAVTLGVIVGSFLVCWVPFFCMNITAPICKTCVSPALFQGLTWLGYCNSALNPLIYSAFNKDFRDAFRRILTGRRDSNPRPVTTNGPRPVTATLNGDRVVPTTEEAETAL